MLHYLLLKDYMYFLTSFDSLSQNQTINISYAKSEWEFLCLPMCVLYHVRNCAAMIITQRRNPMIELKLPRTLLHWIETNRGEMSRSAYIVHLLVNRMNKEKIEKHS